MHMFYYTEYDTSLGDAFGPLILIGEDDNLIGVYTDGQRQILNAFEPKLVKNETII